MLKQVIRTSVAGGCFALNPKKTDGPISRPSFLLCEIRRMAPILFFPFYPSCSVCCCAVNTVILMHRPQLSAPAAAIPLILPPHKCFQSICLNECKVFQHAHVVFCSVPFVQCFQPFTRVYGTFKAKGFLACAFLNGAVPAGFSFSAMAASIAGKPLALIGLAQSAIHSAGRHKLL